MRVDVFVNRRVALRTVAPLHPLDMLGTEDGVAGQRQCRGLVRVVVDDLRAAVRMADMGKGKVVAVEVEPSAPEAEIEVFRFDLSAVGEDGRAPAAGDADLVECLFAAV